MARIYLDHHATTPVDPGVLDAMLPYFGERHGNASSQTHAFGREAAAAVEGAREDLARLIGADPRDIVFTSGATESNNLALRGLLAGLGPGPHHVVTSALEHAAVLAPCRWLERRGVALDVVGVDAAGLVDPAALRAALRPETRLVSLMAANNEIGTVQPVAEVGRMCRERGIVLHCDAVQALGRIPVDVGTWGVDLMSLSAHKVYGPKGVGALYLRRGRRPRLRLEPLALGGGQEGGLRPGTLNVPGIVGFGVAARLASVALGAGEPARIASLRDRLLEGLRARLPGVELNGASFPRLPGNLHISIDRVEAETLVLRLGDRVALSSGAACSEAGGQGSHVLRALGLPDSRVYTAVRIGVGRYNTEAEIDAAVALLAEAAEAVRRATQFI